MEEQRVSDEFVVGLVEGANYVQQFVGGGQQIHKEECRYSSDSPFTQPDGLFVSLSTGVGVGRRFLASELPAELFLQLQFRERPLEATADAATGAITGARTEVEKNFALRVFVRRTEAGGVGGVGGLLEDALVFPFAASAAEAEGGLVPEGVAAAAQYVVEAPSGEATEAVVAYSAMEEQPEISRFSFSLEQESPQNRRAAVDGEICEFTGERCSNLWLNLSDGFIGGGRKQASGAGAVGSGTDGARLHYEEAKRAGKEYPLVVKLGTITECSAEVYSYAEDAMVEDANLTAHLAHWGVDRGRLAKTGKSLMELEYELNKDFAFEKILGHEQDAQPVLDLVGLRNLGNTCYINAVLQLLGRLREFTEFGHSTQEPTVRRALDKDSLEWSKMLEALENRASQPGSGWGRGSGWGPVSFRRQFCGNHPDFKTHQQQDVVEFLQFLLDEKKLMPANLDTLFRFEVANDLVLPEQGRGRRELVTESLLSLQVPREAATGESRAAAKKPKLEETEVVSLERCLAKTFGETEICDFRYRGAVAKAVTRHSMASFPKYLFVAVRRYYLDEAWQPQKMDVAVPMPDTLNLDVFRSPTPALDLPPLEEEAAASPEVASLVEMGFSAELAARALKRAGGSVEAAMDLLFAGAVQEELPTSNGSGGGGSGGGGSGSGEFRLVGFVSHLGKSVGTGHYVAHWRRETASPSGESEWVLFNDERVTQCSEPPTQYGYLYLYAQQ